MDIDIDIIIARAETLLAFLGEVEAAGVLIEGGVTPEMAFLAVKAAQV